MKQILIKEKKFEGKYVALRDLNHPIPLADGDNAEDVYNAAVHLGTKNPLLLYVPAEGMVQIY
ncbi:MAG: hypothetical protein HQL23_07130 [Candidatus Omnitrophica bacterium]|nr:hypothetical protein [Candidatus Omnitrophota bacterium]